MTYKKLKRILKEELKALSKDIRLKKSERKSREHGWVPGLFTSREQFRIKHIAYCLLRGTPYEKIESKHRENLSAKFCKKQADKFVEQYQELLNEETLCNSA